MSSLGCERVTHAVFLAGGRGSRISQLTEDLQTPKQLLPINGETSLGHGVETVRRQFPEIKIVIVSSPVWAALLQEQFANTTVVIQPKPLGNADALRIATEEVRGGEHVLCFNGDHLLGLDAKELQTLVETHLHNGFVATVLLEEPEMSSKPEFIWKYDDSILVGRDHVVYEQPNPNSGGFVGAFIARLDWLKSAVNTECLSAKAQGIEAKTTELLLHPVTSGTIGVYKTDKKHWGINTPQEYMALLK